VVEPGILIIYSCIGRWNGGGIIFITANNLIGNGIKYRQWPTGRANISRWSIGCGAGRTIIMDILNSYTGSVIYKLTEVREEMRMMAKYRRCYGRRWRRQCRCIYFTELRLHNRDTNGGAAGLEISSDPDVR